MVLLNFMETDEKFDEKEYICLRDFPNTSKVDIHFPELYFPVKILSNENKSEHQMAKSCGLLLINFTPLLAYQGFDKVLYNI